MLLKRWKTNNFFFKSCIQERLLIHFKEWSLNGEFRGSSILPQNVIKGKMYKIRGGLLLLKRTLQSNLTYPAFESFYFRTTVCDIAKEFTWRCFVSPLLLPLSWFNSTNVSYPTTVNQSLKWFQLPTEHNEYSRRHRSVECTSTSEPLKKREIGDSSPVIELANRPFVHLH